MGVSLTIQDIEKNKPANSLLTVVSFSHLKTSNSGRKMAMFNCICECGNACVANGSYVKIGETKSCGCLLKKSPINKKYTTYHPKLKAVWYAIVDRCTKPRNQQYNDYGGAGVKVCQEWLDNPQVFFDWSIANGWQPGLNIDKDKIGSGFLYSPDMCCILTHQENCSYMKKCKKFEYEGDLLTMAEISRRSGIPESTLQNRLINLRLSVIDAINFIPKKGYRNKKEWLGKRAEVRHKLLTIKN